MADPSWSASAAHRLRRYVERSLDPGDRLDAAEALLTPDRITGYRMWAVGPGRIVGLHGRAWRSHRMEAECLQRRCDPKEGSPHLGPEAGCDGRCGINAYVSARGLVEASRRAPVPRRLASSSPDVASPIPEGFFGAVALSGRVIEHERGYRAQRAEIVRLVFVHGLTVRATSDPETIADRFPDPAGARRRFETVVGCETGAELPEVVERLLAG
jgi:hypothetical protein